METYVVRIVDPSEDDTLRGVVRRVSDGSERAFHGTDQLVTLLGAPDGPAAASSSGEAGR